MNVKRVTASRTRGLPVIVDACRRRDSELPIVAGAGAVPRGRRLACGRSVSAGERRGRRARLVCRSGAEGFGCAGDMASLPPDPGSGSGSRGRGSTCRRRARAPPGTRRGRGSPARSSGSRGSPSRFSIRSPRGPRVDPRFPVRQHPLAGDVPMVPPVPPLPTAAAGRGRGCGRAPRAAPPGRRPVRPARSCRRLDAG